MWQSNPTSTSNVRPCALKKCSGLFYASFGGMKDSESTRLSRPTKNDGKTVSAADNKLLAHNGLLLHGGGRSEAVLLSTDNLAYFLRKFLLIFFSSFLLSIYSCAFSLCRVWVCRIS